MIDVPIEEIYKLYISGESVEEISKKYKVSYSLISKRLKKYALEKNIDIKTERRKNKIYFK